MIALLIFNTLVNYIIQQGYRKLTNYLTKTLQAQLAENCCKKASIYIYKGKFTNLFMNLES